MSYQLQFFNAKVQSGIEAWPIGISASFVRIAEQMVVSGPKATLNKASKFTVLH